MSRILEKVQGDQARQDVPAFRPGDTVRVHVRLKEAEGEKERIQPFEGVVIKKRGKSTGASFTVRRVSFGVGIERVFHVNSPSISSIEVLRQADLDRLDADRAVGPDVLDEVALDCQDSDLHACGLGWSTSPGRPGAPDPGSIPC